MTNWLLTLGRYTVTVKKKKKERKKERKKSVLGERLHILLVILQISKAIGRAL